jgi:hypothetical protein
VDVVSDPLRQPVECGLGTIELPGWLDQWSQLNRVVEEVGAIVYIESTLDTTDESKEKAFLNFIEHIERTTVGLIKL